MKDLREKYTNQSMKVGKIRSRKGSGHKFKGKGREQRKEKEKMEKLTIDEMKKSTNQQPNDT